MRWIHTLVVTFAIVMSGIAFAQADTRAEQLKNAGIAAAKKKDWELARKSFDESYALDPRPLTLFNLAGAQRNTQRLVQARASYRRFLDDTKDSRESNVAKFRGLAEDALEKLASEIPTVRVRVKDVAPPYSIVLDERVLEPQEMETPIGVDPGEHTVVVRRGQEEIDRKSVTVAKGNRIETELVGKPLPKPAPTLPAPRVENPLPPSPPARHENSGGLLSSGWFWGITSAILVGAAVGGGFYYYQTHTESPTRGTLGSTSFP